MKFLFKILFLIISFSVFFNNTFSEYEQALKAYKGNEYNKSLELTYYNIDNNSSLSCYGYKLLSDNYLKLGNKNFYNLYKAIYTTCINIPKKAPSFLLKGLSKYNLKQDSVSFLFYIKLLNYDVIYNNKKYDELIGNKEISFLLNNKNFFIKNSYNNYYAILALYYYKNNNKELFNKNYEKIKNKNFYFLPVLKYYFLKINGIKNINLYLDLLKNNNIILISNNKVIFNFYGRIYKLISKKYYLDKDINNAIKYYFKSVKYGNGHLYDNFLISIFRKNGIEPYKEIVENYDREYYNFVYNYLAMRVYLKNKDPKKPKIDFKKAEFLISYYKNNIGKVKTNDPLLINGLFEGLISHIYYKNLSNKSYFNTKEKKFIEDNEMFFKSFLVNKFETKKLSTINTNIIKNNSLSKNYKYIIFLLIIFIIILGFFIKSKKNV